jgi:hypothetical protein
MGFAFLRLNGIFAVGVHPYLLPNSKKDYAKMACNSLTI